MRLQVILRADPALAGYQLGPDDSVVSLHPILEDRIIQEEVWAQTVWPEGEVELVSLAVLLRDPERMVRIRQRLSEVIWLGHQATNDADPDLLTLLRALTALTGAP